MGQRNVIDLTEVSHEEWLLLRQKGLGGSDVSVCMGLNPFSTKYELYLSKVNPPEPIDNERMYWGRMLESQILQGFADTTKLEVVHKKEMKFHDSIPFIFGNVDGFVMEGKKIVAMVEIKNISDQSFKYWKNGIPDYYYAQIQNYLSVYDLDLGYMSVLIGGQRLEVFTVERDHEFIQKMYEDCTAFWNNYVVPKIEPPLEVSDYEKRDAEEGSQIEAEREALFAYQRLGALREQIGILEKEKVEAENELKMIMKDNSALTFQDKVLCTWKTTETTRFNTSLFRQRNPKLASEYLTKSKQRRFIYKEEDNDSED